MTEESPAAHALFFMGALSAYLWPGFVLFSLFRLPSHRKKARG